MPTAVIRSPRPGVTTVRVERAWQFAPAGHLTTDQIVRLGERWLRVRPTGPSADYGAADAIRLQLKEAGVLMHYDPDKGLRLTW